MGAARKTDKLDPWVSLSEAARMLGESRPSVLKRAIKGEITAKHEADRTIITRASIAQVLADRQ